MNGFYSLSICARLDRSSEIGHVIFNHVNESSGDVCFQFQNDFRFSKVYFFLPGSDILKNLNSLTSNRFETETTHLDLF